MTAQTVEMFVDPLCPWAWLTSRWLHEAERVRPLTVVTKVFSLSVVNAENEDYRSHFEAGTRALRVMIAARRAGGEPAIRAAYTALGEAHHERDELLGDAATLGAAAAAAGLGPELVTAALTDDSVVAELTEEHRDAVGRGAFGVASLSVGGGPLFFGPIVDTRIEGEDAGRLWDVVLPLLTNPHLFELKRERGTEPDIGRVRLRAAQAAVAG